MLCFGGHFEFLIRERSASAKSGTEITESLLGTLIHRFQKKTGNCMQARLNSPLAFKMADEMPGKNEQIQMYVG